MVNSYKGGEAENVEQLGSQTSRNSYPQGGRVKRHCAKWWWLHLVIFIAITLGLTLGLVYGAVPSIGQKTINESTLSVESISISNPSNTNFTFGMNSTIHGSVPVTSHLGPQQLAMYLVHADGTQGKPFMDLNLSRIDLHNTIPIHVDGYPMQIADQAAFLEFVTVVLSSKTFNMGVKSRPDLFVGSIKNAVNYEKVVNLNGFNNLTGVALSNAQLFDKALPDGTNMISDVLIPNPSKFTLEMGNLAMDFSSITGPIGTGTVYNLTLVPGDNHVKVRAPIPEPNYTILKAALGIPGVNVTLTGHSVVYNGMHINWLETPLHATNLSVPAPNAAPSS